MKLIELLRALDSHTYVRINAVDVENTKGHIILGETNIKGWTELMRQIKAADCAEYTHQHPELHGNCVISPLY